MDRTIKTGVLQLSKAAGLFALVRDSRWRQRRLLILCYHGISLDDEHEWNPSLFIPPQQFESRLALLKQGGFHVLPLGQALQLLSADELPPRSVAITFDDGLYDFYGRAWPLLSAYGFPATVYLTTYYCEFNRPVFYVAASYILWKARDRTWEAREILGRSTTFDLSNAESRRAAWGALTTLADEQKLSARDKDALLARLAAALGVDYEHLTRTRIVSLLNPAEVTELARLGIDFQLHTHRHRTRGDAPAVRDEIRANRERIARMTGAQSSHFCYPSGFYRPAVVKCLAAEGIVSATTCDPGLASRQSLRLLLPRLVDSSAVSPLDFEGWLTGVADWLPRKRSYGALPR
jgi:peptidoglycan/xylan/chitin deacetylase (PgdA/CDA1 family)